jgi:2-oxoisovalerate dehydrogenase E1 component
MELYPKAFLIRALELKLLDLFAQGRLFGTVHTCIGQEFSALAVARCLAPGDIVFSNHRCHGHFLALTDDAEGLVAEVMGKASGVCGGRGGSQHLASRGFFSNGVQGGIAPVAAGLALALKLRGSPGIAAVFIGDGTLGEGVLYETLNIASKWDLPLLAVCEDNGYAQSTPRGQTLAGGILERARAFGIESASCATRLPGELAAAAEAAVSRVRTSGRPFFLRVETFRLMAHSKGDDPRGPEELKAAWEQDPLEAFKREQPALAGEFESAAAERVRAAVLKASRSPDPEPEPEPPRPAQSPSWAPAELEGPAMMADRIYGALRRALERDGRVLILGEDVEAPYGGAFKITRDLSALFPGRVRNTPISEAAITGVGNGLALAGFTPVVEIMFGDFLTLAADQFINHAAKFSYMYGGRFQVPLIVRSPMGARRGYGPTHSQSLEKHFLGLPGTRVLALHPRMDAGAFYDALLANADRPTLVVENKLTYGTRLTAPVPEGFVYERTGGDFPTLRLRPLGRPDWTLLCYGGMLPHAEEAASVLFSEHDVLCEVICPVSLYPFDRGPLAESLRGTGRLLAVEEGHGFAGFGAEAAAQAAELLGGGAFLLRRLCSAEHPIPCSGALENASLPGAEAIVEAVLEASDEG